MREYGVHCANGARDNANVTRRSHYQKSLFRDNDRAVFRAKLVIIYVDWIALLRRLLIIFNCKLPLSCTVHNFLLTQLGEQEYTYHKRCNYRFHVDVPILSLNYCDDEAEFILGKYLQCIYWPPANGAITNLLS